MSFLNVFSNNNEKMNSGTHTERKKAKTLYSGGVDLAEHGGIYYKSTPMGQYKGTYIGDIYIKDDSLSSLLFKILSINIVASKISPKIV